MQRAPIEKPTRLPQARSLATRRRLLEATVECLVELGYARTTTAEICRRARVSQGALFKHFSSKTALLGCTVEHLFGALVGDFRRDFARLEGASDPVHEAFAIVRSSFREPRLLAAFELYAAARTDAPLREVLAPVMAEHRANLLIEARRIFGAPAQLEALVDLVMNALQGGALGALVLPDPAAERRAAERLERMVRRELAGV